MQRVRMPVGVVNMEEWRAVSGWEGFYEVSSVGRVRSVARTVVLANRWGGFNERRLPARILAQAEFAKRYWQVTLKEGGRRSTDYVHRLVCRAFNGLPTDDRNQVAHGDGDGFNNNKDNLRWATPLENCADTVRHGRSIRGERHPATSLTFEIVEKIRKEGGPEMDAQIAQELGIKKRTVSHARHGHTWKWMNDV